MNTETLVELTRQELYERVWSTPIRTLAGEWGLSDVGLAKICQRHQIPRPPQGHWTRIRSGKKVRRIPLPAVEDDRRAIIKITSDLRTDCDPAQDPEIAQRIRQESDPARAVTVSESSQIRHPIVRATKESLKGASPDKYGRVKPNWQFKEAHFDVQVAPQNVSRALRILQELVYAMAARGYELSEGSGRDRYPSYKVMGETFCVAIRERSKRCERHPIGRMHRDPFDDRWEYRPSGLLELTINDRGSFSDCTLRDTAKHPLEGRLNEAIVAMLRTVDRRRKQAELAQIEAAKKAEQKRVAVEQEIEIRSDSARIDRLRHLTQQWETYQRLRRFVEAVRTEAAVRSPAVDPDTLDWLTWADSLLKEYDPLSGGEDLPVYSLSEEDRDKLRRECLVDWCDWTGKFVRRGGKPT